MFDFFKDKAFLKTAFTIAIPVALQNIINTGINFIDTLMVATLDANSVAAVGICNNVFNFWNMFSFGIISGGMILSSQFYGANNEKALRKIFGLTIAIDFIASLIFFMPCFFMTDSVLNFLTTSNGLIIEGCKYLKIVCFMYPIQAFTLTILLILRSFGKVKITVYSSLVTLISNVVLNYALINGNLGFPSLGVSGAAIATIISRCIEMIILISYLFITKSILVSNMKDVFTCFEIDYLKLFVKTGSLTALDEFVYGLGQSLYMVVFGRLPETQVSAASIMIVFYNLLLTFFIGFCSASSVSIGIELGRNQIENAKKYAKYYIHLFISLCVITCIVILIVKTPFEFLYKNLGEEVIYYIDVSMYVIMALVIVGSLSYLFLIGILRAGGDVKFAVIIDLVSCWLIGLPLSYVIVMIFKMPVHIATLSMVVEEGIKTIMSYIRYKKNRWTNNLVSNIN